MVDKIFHPEDLVWAKMPNYPHWPGIIVAPDDDMIETCGPLDPKKGEHYVYFFGTENYAPIPIKHILPHKKEMFDEHDKKKRISKDLRAAIDAMKEYCLSSAAVDLHSEEAVYNDEGPSCDLISNVEVVTEHSRDNSDDLSCQRAMSEVKLVTSKSEIYDVCSEPLTSSVVARQAIDIGVISSSEPATPGLSCEPSTSEVVAKQAIGISIESSCEPTTSKVDTTEHNIKDLCEQLISKVVAKQAIDFGVISSSGPTTPCLSCEPSTSDVVAKQAIDISIESSCEPTTSKVVTTEYSIEDLCCEPSTSKVVAEQVIDSGFEITMPKVKRLCVTSAESPEVPCEESFSSQSRRIGFLGLGKLGVNIVRKLIETDHDVTVYDKNLDNLNYSNIMGAKVAKNIIDICDKCELIFCCADAFCVQEIFLFDEYGTLTGLQKAKKKYLRGYIEMTPMDETQLIMTAEAVSYAGVPFLEVPVSGASFLENGELNFFAAGDKNLFIDCLPIFRKVSNKEATYVGNKIGQAFVADQMFNALTGSLRTAFQETLHFATNVKKIPSDNLRELFDLCEMNSSLITQQIDAVQEKPFPSTYSLDYLQQDIQRVLSIGNQVCHSMPIVAQSHNSSIHAQSYNFSIGDISNIYASTLLQDP